MGKRLLSGVGMGALIMGCCVVFFERRLPAAPLPIAPSVVSLHQPSSGPQFQDRAVEEQMLALSHHVRVGMLLTQAPRNQSPTVLSVVVIEPKAGTK